jgi:alpha-1,3-rhamnosyltransferase
MEINNQPLVSVPIITYNSSETILETLESIKEQTYQNIELIISDDCSKDNTVEICQQWVEQNKDRFVRAVVSTSPVNAGVSGNCNRSKEACQGEWIKGLAGDDALLPTCIEEFVKYINQYPDTLYVFCRMEGFGRPQEEIDEYMNRCFDYSFFNLSADEQYKRLVFRGNCVPAPAGFSRLRKQTSNIPANDERISMIEDYPKWMDITKSGIQLRFVDKTLVRYRLSENSISTTHTPSLKTKQSIALIYIHYLFKPRFKFHKSPVKKLGEIRKYIHAAHTAWGGCFWKSLMWIDNIMAKVFNKLGYNIKL